MQTLKELRKLSIYIDRLINLAEVTEEVLPRLECECAAERCDKCELQQALWEVSHG